MKIKVIYTDGNTYFSILCDELRPVSDEYYRALRYGKDGENIPRNGVLRILINHED